MGGKIVGRPRVYTPEQRRERQYVIHENWRRRKRNLPPLPMPTITIRTEISDEELERRLEEKFKKEGWD